MDAAPATSAAAAATAARHNGVCSTDHLQTVNRKKTWLELRDGVTDLRKQLSKLSSMVPMNIEFRKLSDGRTRIYFLSTPPNGWETTLLCTDIPAPNARNQKESTTRQRLQWQLLLEPAVSSFSSTNTYARAFQLLLERKRLSTWGITSYELHKPSGRIIFPASSSMYQCLDTGYNTNPLYPSEIVQLRGTLDPQICPQNSELIAYIQSGDIWVINTISGNCKRLTNAHDENKSYSDNPLSAGVPSYVMQEEFSRYQGYWWQPHSDDGIYRIVYEEVDESEVLLFKFPNSSQAGDTGVEYEEYRFPRAGTQNAKSKLKLVQFVLSETLNIQNVIVKDLQCPLNFHFAWMEYIVRFDWTPDGQSVFAQLLDRQQRRTEVVLIPLTLFNDVVSCSHSSTTTTPSESAGTAASTPPADHSWQSSLNKMASPIQVIYSQNSPTWININDLFTFIEYSETEVTFLWGSEETGYRHLYLITASLSPPMNGVAYGGARQDAMDEGHADSAHLVARIVSKKALTSGDWEVLGRNVWVDYVRGIVYFMGLRETPLEKHAYAVSLNRPDCIRLLTKTGFSYSVEFDEDCAIMIQVFCNIHQMPTCEVHRIAHTNEADASCVGGIQLQALGYLFESGMPSSPQLQRFSPTIYSRHISSGELLYAMVFRPHNYRRGQKYPTVLNVYGGPEVQTVNNTYKGMRHLRMHMLAAQGYCVVCIDSRGSRHRGVEFESHLWRRMGCVELSDQVEVLRSLAEELEIIDMDRVAIHGWSYGGYLSLMGLIQYPDVFRLAIAGAPVTNWELYDTGYTERYMDLPEENKQGYTTGSVLSYVNQFPDEDNRLLIIHGLIDENVHFFHTSELINMLIKANKPYQLQVYPKERHSLRNLEASKHYETTLLSFLQNNL